MNYNERKLLDAMSRIAVRLSDALERNILIRARMKKNIIAVIADVGFIGLGLLLNIAGWVSVIAVILSLDVMWHVSKMMIRYKSLNAALVAMDLVEYKKDRIFGPGETKEKEREDAYILDGLRNAHYDLIGVKARSVVTDRVTLMCKMSICVATGFLVGMVSVENGMNISSWGYLHAAYAMVALLAIVGLAFGIVSLIFKDVKIESTVKTINDCIDGEL